jgi:hypothetical protein
MHYPNPSPFVLSCHCSNPSLLVPVLRTVRISADTCRRFVGIYLFCPSPVHYSSVALFVGIHPYWFPSSAMLSPLLSPHSQKPPPPGGCNNIPGIFRATGSLGIIPAIFRVRDSFQDIIAGKAQGKQSHYSRNKTLALV